MLVLIEVSSWMRFEGHVADQCEVVGDVAGTGAGVIRSTWDGRLMMYTPGAGAIAHGEAG